ncbi:MAG: hypothetical protein ACYSO4_07610, partial [Planctomycetota bacterium]
MDMLFGFNNLLMLSMAMTPQERFRAMQRIDTDSSIDFLTSGWLELVGWLAIALSITVLGVLYKRRIQKK